MKNIIFKPKQVICLESVFLDRDTLAILPTGYGKSATFHLLPQLLQRRNVCENCICDQPIVCSGITVKLTDGRSIICVTWRRVLVLQFSEQIVSNVKPVSIDYDQRSQHDDMGCRLSCKIDAEMKSLERGQYSLVFCHPEAVKSSSEGS